MYHFDDYRIISHQSLGWNTVENPVFAYKITARCVCVALMEKTSEYVWFFPILRQESIHWKIVTSALACSATWRLIMTSQRAGAGPRFWDFLSLPNRSWNLQRNSHLARFPKNPQNTEVLPFPLVPGNCSTHLPPCFCHRTNLPLWKSVVHQNILIQAKAKARPCPASCASWTGRVESDSTNHRPFGCFWNPPCK